MTQVGSVPSCTLWKGLPVISIFLLYTFLTVPGEPSETRGFSLKGFIHKFSFLHQF